MAAAVESGARLAGRSPPICREMVRTLAHGHAYDGSKATRELGLEYRPAVDTLRRLVSWLEETGLV
jgi:dihydroflavonol-4-reductase